MSVFFLFLNSLVLIMANTSVDYLHYQIMLKPQEKIVARPGKYHSGCSGNALL